MKEIDEQQNVIEFKEDALYLEDISAPLNTILQYTNLIDSEGMANDTESALELAGITTNSQMAKANIYIPNNKFSNGLPTIPFTGKHSINTFVGKSNKDSITDTTNRIVGYLDESLEKNKNNPQSGVYRANKAIKNQIMIITDPDYIDCLKIDNSFNEVCGQCLVSLPEPMFQKTQIVNKKVIENGKEVTKAVEEPVLVDGKPVYEKNTEKYDKLMNDYCFLTIMEERQKFMMEKTMPYVKAMKNGSLTPEMKSQYKSDYKKMLESQQKYHDQIKNFNPDDILIKTNKTLPHSDLLKLRWTSTLGNASSKRNLDDQAMMAKGWNPEELGLINEIKHWHAGNKTNFEDKHRSKEELNFFKKAIDTFQPTYDKINETVVNAPSKKIALLEEARKTIISKKSPTDEPLIQAIDNNIQSLTVQAANNRKKYFKDFDLVAAKKKINDIYKALDDVDFFMFGKGSKAFDDMLTAVKQAKTFADKNLKGDKVVSDKKLIEFMDKCNDAALLTTGYINKKKSEIIGSNYVQKNDETKQKREQKRISASLDALEGLNSILDSGEKTFNNVMKEKTQKKIEQKLAKEERSRGVKNARNDEYERSIFRSIDYAQKAHDSFYTRGTQSFSAYVERVKQAPKTTLTDENTMQQMLSTKSFNNIFEAVMPNHNIPLDQKGNKKAVTTAEIKQAYQNEIAAQAERNRGKNKDQSIADLRSTLLTENTMQWRRRQMQNKVPQAPSM